MSDPIKVGLIRCDTHGLWYGPMMARHDPLVLLLPMDPAVPSTHSWQRGGCHRFLYTNYGNPLKMTAPFVEGFEIVKLWDEERSVAEQAARVFLNRPVVCDHYEQVSDGVDLVMIAECDGDGIEHLKLATPGLTRGVATFVDKPFADTVADARAMLDLADKHGAPIFSLSIPRIDPSIAELRNRLPEVGDPTIATLCGYGTHPAGLIHTISTIQHLFGPGVETLRVLTAPRQTSIHFDYNGKPGAPAHGVILHTEAGARPASTLTVSILGTMGEIHSNVPGHREWVYGTAAILRILKDMVATRQTPALMTEVVETIATLEAYRLARDTARPARVADFLR